MRNIKFVFLMLFILVAIMFIPVFNCYSKDDAKSLVYIAGNPNLYPIEYYDKATDSYKGVIPDIIKEFSVHSNYNIVYINSGNKDKRHDLAEKLQVDLISACQEGDLFDDQSWNEGLVVFSYDTGGKSYEYRILHTDVADSELIKDLEEFLSKVSDDKIKGMLINSNILHKNDNSLLSFIILISVSSFLLLILLLNYIKFKKKIKIAECICASDELTGIGNYRYLYKQYRLIADYNRILYSAVYLRLDIDRLGKICSINERNSILKYTAELLEKNKEDRDIIASVTTGSFVILRVSINESNTEKFVDTIINGIQEYIKKVSKSSSLFCNAGIYKVESKNAEIDEILYNAERSCVDAVEKGSYYSYFKNLNYLESLILNNTDSAFENEEIEVYLHFFVEPITGKIVGAEALSRWNHPEKGILQPKSFIYIMERESTITKLDYYVLEKTCVFLEMLYKRGVSDFFITCNFSRKTLESDGFVSEATSIMQRYNFDHNSLIFEMTESALRSDVDLIYSNLISISKHGIRIVIDDFGRGCSSYEDLQKYTFQGVKLDKSLIDNVLTDRGRAILKGVISIGHDLGMTVLGEGVESLDQVEALIGLNCDVMQGYYFYYPMPLNEAYMVYLKNHQELV